VKHEATRGQPGSQAVGQYGRKKSKNGKKKNDRKINLKQESAGYSSPAGSAAAPFFPFLRELSSVWRVGGSRTLNVTHAFHVKSCG
jgi:hypothetical protein